MNTKRTGDNAGRDHFEFPSEEAAWEYAKKANFEFAKVVATITSRWRIRPTKREQHDV